MAHLIPSALLSLRQDGGRYRELDILNLLADALPEGYEIFHSIALHTVRDSTDHYGEIDIVVLGPTGNVLLMEVKAGDVIFRDGYIYKLYRNEEHDISRQCRFQYGGMVSRLKEAGLEAFVASCLVIPDYRLGNEHAVSIPRERIIDADRYPQLANHVREMLSTGKGCARLDALKQFLRNQFHVSADLGAVRDQLQRTVRVLSDGLAIWVPRITAPSGVMRIQATAGSGKTQLALRLLEQAAADGRAAGYVCYNRSLADHVRRIAPTRTEVSNFHELAVEHFRKTQGEPDFSLAQTFDAVTAAYLADCEGFAPRFDVLIVDEGQDLEPAWIEGVSTLLRPGGQLFLMDDDDQRLYERPGFEIEDAVTIISRDNYRSPRLVCDVINGLGLCASSIRSMNHYKGAVPGFHTYSSKARLLAQTEHAVAELLARGFGLADIVVLTHCGRAKSALIGTREIGPWTTRQFTGAYTRDGDPVWSEGDLMVESVYRYKGQSAPAVVLAEVGFSALSAQDRKKLFVGMTRAQMALEIVLSVEAEQCMMAAIGLEQ